MDIADACHAKGVQAVAVTAGYMHAEPRREFYAKMDAANVDLKGFTEDFYRRLCFGHLDPVLETLKYLRRETPVWLEITTLLIPGENDSDAEIDALTRWVHRELGSDVPLHFTAFHPDFKLQDKPRTPAETLHRARAIALETGLHYVYEGNIFSEGANTCCPKCSELIIRRSWHDVLENRLVQGACPKCSSVIPGVWEKSSELFSRTSGERKTAGNYGHLNL
jgi:pyruvate formate lyase activating enzyme